MGSLVAQQQGNFGLGLAPALQKCRGHVGGGIADGDAALGEDALLGGGSVIRATDDGTRVPHAATGRRCGTGNESGDGLFAVLFGPEAGFDLGKLLDPSYEPHRSGFEDPSVPAPDPAHTAVFAVLQNYVKVNLVRPVGAPHMWHAAMGSHGCELTVLGQHYWKLVDDGLI